MFFKFRKALKSSKPSSGAPTLSGAVMLISSLAVQHLLAGPATLPAAQSGTAVARFSLPPPPTLSIKLPPTPTAESLPVCDEEGSPSVDTVIFGLLGAVAACTARLERFVDPPLLDCLGVAAVVVSQLPGVKKVADIPAEDAMDNGADNMDNGDSDDHQEEREVADSLNQDDDPEPADFGEGNDCSDDDPTGNGGDDEPSDNGDDDTEDSSDTGSVTDPEGTGDDPEDPPPPSSSTGVDDSDDGPLLSEDLAMTILDVLLICLLLYREALEEWLYRVKSVRHVAQPTINVAEVFKPTILVQLDVSTVVLEAVVPVILAQPDDSPNVVNAIAVEPEILTQPDALPALVPSVVEPQILACPDGLPKFIANPNPKPALVPYLSVTLVALVITLFNINFGNDADATPESPLATEPDSAVDVEVPIVEDETTIDIVDAPAVLELTSGAPVSVDNTESNSAIVVPIVEPEVVNDIAEASAIPDTTNVVASMGGTSVEAECLPQDANAAPPIPKPSEGTSTIAIGTSEASPAGQIATTEDISPTPAIDASEASPAGHKVKAKFASSSMGAFAFKSRLPKREKRERAPREVAVETKAPSTQTGPLATMEDESSEMPEEDSVMGGFGYSQRVPRRSKKGRKGKGLPFEWPSSTIEPEQAVTPPVTNIDNRDEEWSVVGHKRKQRKRHSNNDEEEGVVRRNEFGDSRVIDFDVSDSWASPAADDDDDDGWRRVRR
ncbi:hypothetical protein DXG01_012212 [Tephrocybe rancida]|nr:hypothetical protein DXG01_012212 [Tephrocybe rancida]